MKYRHKRKAILIVGSLLFFGIVRFSSYPYKIALFCSAYVLLLFIVGREIYQLATNRGKDIRLSKWQLDIIHEYTHRDAILGNVLAILLIACSSYFVFRGMKHQDIVLLAIGLVTGLVGLLALTQASHIKYVLYTKQNTEPKDEPTLDT
jgi:hypothetical protein